MSKKKNNELVPLSGLGNALISEAKKSIKNEIQDVVIKQVRETILRRDNLLVKKKTISDQIKHINAQIAAIETNQFTVVGPKIHFNDEMLNNDAAHVHPYKAAEQLIYDFTEDVEDSE